MAAGKSDRKFMEMAVEHMRKSRSEHADKHDPLVGAVLVGSDGRLMAATHRGDLRVGDHAEFTLIERYLKDKKLEKATIYVTLEPCTRRNPPKKPCAEWIVKARIGRVLIGMTDPNPDICGRGVQYLLSNGVEVDFFDLDLVRQVMEANRAFIQYYEDQDKTTSGRNEPFEGPSGKELEVVARASMDDLSDDALLAYMARDGQEVAVQSQRLRKVLERGGYAGRTASGKLAPTVAGIALFATAPSEILPQCRVSIETRKGGQTVSDDFEGPLVFFRDHLDQFFRNQMRHFTEIREYDRVKVGEYPTEALREAAFNAVVHRDYQAGARVHITLKETEVEVRSPGGLLKPLSLSRMRAFNAPPYSRNPHIALAFHRMGWIDEKGSGLGRMRDAMMAHGLRPPVFDCSDGYFIARLPGREQGWSSVSVAPGFLTNLEPRQKRIVELVMARGRLGTSECAKEIGIDAKNARIHLRKLVDKGLLEVRGAGPRSAYYLAGSE